MQNAGEVRYELGEGQGYELCATFATKRENQYRSRVLQTITPDFGVHDVGETCFSGTVVDQKLLRNL